MNILFLDQFAELGGAQRCLLDLLPAAERAGWQAHVALPGEGPLVPLLRERQVGIHSLSLGPYSLGRKSVLDAARFLSDLPKVAAEIRALAVRVEPAVVYVNGPRLMPALARARLGLPVIFHAHNKLTARNGAALVAAALRRTNATIIAASRFLAKQWPGRPVRVIYGGVEGPQGRPFRQPPDGPRIGLIGRIAPQKRHKEFVLAAAELAREWPQAEFYLCGDALFGDRAGQRYKQEVLALAPASLRYLGWRDDIYEVLSMLDVLVAPAAGEGGIARVILDAFAAGVPVLVCASGAIPEVIVDGQNGFLLPSPSPSAIARRLRELVPQRDRLATAAEAAHRLWRERFTAERYREEVWRVVESAVPASKRRNTHAAERPTAAVDIMTTE